MSEREIPADFDGYHLVRPIGAGAMGQVFLGHDTLLDRPVAVKMLANRETSSRARQRFLLEARAIARLQHPNVVSIYRVGEIAERPYLVSEYVRGTSLDLLPGKLSSPALIQVARGLARGLSAAHRSGVLHRDIKPANAILADSGDVKLLDFGLAELIDRPAAVNFESRGSRGTQCTPPAAVTLSGALTAEDEGRLQLKAGDSERGGAAEATASASANGPGVVGTPAYMAPELWQGKGATARTDIYSLGGLLFYLAAGRPPYEEGSIIQLVHAVAARDPPKLAAVVPDVDRRLGAIVDRCLARNPADRFPGAGELCDALEQLGVDADAPVPEGNPYRGLHVFEAAHRALLFGRDRAVRAVQEMMTTQPIVVVAGSSGVGKSSLCRAGVLPLVLRDRLGEQRRWAVATMVPGRRPITALLGALAPCLGGDTDWSTTQLAAGGASFGRELGRRVGADRGVVLFIDQLEEVSTVSAPAEAAAFAEVLGGFGECVPGVRVLATVRGDLLTRVAALPGIGDAIAHGLYLARPLDRHGIRAAIVGPAQVQGFHFESPAMVDALVDATAGTDGGLPLLQFALAELWEHRDPERRIISASALQQIGGVEGALARHADDVIEHLLPADRLAARRVLLKLVSGVGTRLRRTEGDLVASGADAKRALQALVQGRLVVGEAGEAGSGYEIAHEALISGWPSLSQWVEDDATTRPQRERVATGTLEWERLGRAREALWGARQLAEIAPALAQQLAGAESQFVEASRRAVRRRRGGTVSALAGIPLLIGLLFGALTLQRQREVAGKVQEHTRAAEEALNDARSGVRASEQLRGIAFSLFDGQQTAAAEEAWTRVEALTGQAQRSLRDASQSLETALTLDRGRRDVKDLVGDVFYERVLLAERDGNRDQREELLRRLALYDADGSRNERLNAPHHVEIVTTPAGAQVVLHRVVRHGDRLDLDAGEARGMTPLSLDLAPSSYVLAFAAAGRVEVRYPLLASRASTLSVALELPSRDEVPAGFVYVPPGHFLTGTSGQGAPRSFLRTSPLHEATTAGFLIARTETTFGDWLAYLRALPPTERQRRSPHLGSRGFHGALDLRETGSLRYRLLLQPATRAYSAEEGEPIVYSARGRRQQQDWRRLPVAGVTWDAAASYVAWLASSGRVPGARLCTEWEWERAARGADGREYPHGDQLLADDANFDETYGREPLGFGPDEVGSHPASRSPFGIDDMAGNVWEWVSGAAQQGGHIGRGGSYYFDSNTARTTNREIIQPELPDLSLGMRVCADYPAASHRAELARPELPIRQSASMGR